MSDVPATNALAADAETASDATQVHRGNSRAVKKLRINLGTTPAQKVLDRHYGVVSANLYHMCVMLPILTNTEIAGRVETLLEQYFEVAHSGIHAEIQRVQALLEQAGMADDSDTSFTRPNTVTIEITTPYGARFARLTSDLDRLIQLIENAFLSGIFSSVQRATAIRHGSNRISRLGGRIRNLHNSLKSLLSKGKKATLDDFHEAGTIAPAKDDVSDLSPTEEFPEQAEEPSRRVAA